jgi:hypothetical protein
MVARQIRKSYSQTRIRIRDTDTNECNSRLVIPFRCFLVVDKVDMVGGHKIESDLMRLYAKSL